MQYRGLELDPFQVEAIEHIKQNRSVLVSAPTGTGKTIIADYIVDQSLQLHKEVIYTAPIKALSNQKYRDYCRLYGTDNVGLITGDLVINRDAPIRIMTTEILRNMLLQGESLPHLAYVIIDEIHFLDDPERGTVWEEVLIYLPNRVKVLGLSATLANIEEFAAWLTYVRDEDVQVVIENTRHVPLSIFLANRDAGIVDMPRYRFLHGKWTKMAKEAMANERQSRSRDGGRRRRRSGRLKIPGQKETRHHELVEMLGPDFRPILYFAFSRKLCEVFAKDLARKQGERSYTTTEEATEIKAAVDKFDATYEKVMTGEQERMYLKGIAFHHAGLHVALKAFVEDLYERKLIKVLYCTSTFALGINMPARSVVFENLRKYNGVTVAPLTVREFMQMAGRAGRRGIDHVGYVIVKEEFVDFDGDEDSISAYLAGRHEQVTSSFNLSFNSVVNLLHRHGHSLDGIRTVIDRSFLNFHFVQKAQKDQERIIDIEQSLVDDGWDPNDPEAGRPPRNLMNRVQRYRKMKKGINRNTERVFQDLVAKVEVLKSIGYVDDELQFNAGARVLQHVQIEEIFSTELVLSGLFDSLDSAELFAVFCVVCNSFGRSVEVLQRPRGELAKLARKLREIRYGDAVQKTEKLNGVQVTFTPEMLIFGKAWYEGHSLQELLLMLDSTTDVSGDLVSAFRRAKDLSMQMRRVFAEDPWMMEKLKEISKTVSRDEVEVVD